MSNVIQFRPATREQVFSRTCIYGVGGAGKTLTMLLMLRALCPTGRYAIIDTERGRSKKYLGLFKTDQYPRGLQFDILTPHSFSPSSLTEAIAAATEAGYEGLGVDSGSHYWDGADGMQEQVDRLSGNSRNTFGTGWKEMNPVERRMWDAVTGAPMHVVMTLRSKADYVIEEKENRQGRMTATPKKVGLRPRQRDGFEYEFDVVGSMDLDHVLTVIKSDMPVVPVGAQYEKPGEEFATLIRDFCLEGEEATGSPLQYRARALAPDLTLAGSRELYDEVELHGHVNTSVLDEHGAVVTLGELIRRRAAAIKAADDHATRAAAQQRAAATATAAPARGVPAARQAPTSKAERLNTAVTALLSAADVDAAGKAEARAVKSPLVNEDVSGLLDERDRDELSIGQGDPVTLKDLAAMVCTYVQGNKHAVRRPTVVPDQPASDVVTDQAGVEYTREEIEEHLREDRAMLRDAVGQ